MMSQLHLTVCRVQKWPRPPPSAPVRQVFVGQVVPTSGHTAAGKKAGQTSWPDESIAKLQL